MSSFNLASYSVPKEFNMKKIQRIHDKEYEDISREVNISSDGKETLKLRQECKAGLAPADCRATGVRNVPRSNLGYDDTAIHHPLL